MGDDQRYSLRWNDFYSNVISAFKSLKESEDFVDVTIACDGKSLKAHRLILSAASPFFRKLLKDHPHPHPIVILKDVRYQDMESLLSFMYLGEVQICQEDLTEFLRTAQTLQIKGLTDVPHIPRSPRSPSPSLTPPPLHHIPEVRMDNLSDDAATSPSDSPPKAAKRLKTATNINGTTTATGTTIIAGENGVGIGMDEGENSHENHNHFNSNLHSHETNSDNNTPEPANASRVEKNEASDPDRNSSSPSNNEPNNKTIKSSSSTANHNDNGKLQDNEKRSLSTTNHTSILIQALEQGRHHNYERDRGADENSIKRDSISHQSAMMIDDDSSPDEEDMKYDEKGMDGIESCEELSAHALSDAMSRFPAAAALAYGLQGSLGSLPSFLPAGPSNSSMDVSRRSLELLRVRATDPRPCPKCGKIYRSAHTLRTHLEDKHTICPGYRCVLCGTVAKSRNSLHSHMSRQHRGISTKDLPVLPMPAPFDPGLAARLLSKAGLKFPSSDIATGTSPTSARRSGGLEVTPVPSSEKNPAESPKSGRSGSHPVTPKIDPGTTGSAILDTYLQFIAENSIALGGGLHYQRNPNAAPHHRSNDKNQIHSSGEVDDDESGEEDDS